jgi:hypothetical protein
VTVGSATFTGAIGVDNTSGTTTLNGSATFHLDNTGVD